MRIGEAATIGYVDFSTYSVESTDFANVSYYSNTTENKIIQILDISFNPTTHFVECEYMRPYTDVGVNFDIDEIADNILTTVTIRYGFIYVRLKNYDLPNSRAFDGTLKIKIYAR